jgi:aspartate aminotransferase-like enzyme
MTIQQDKTIPIPQVEARKLLPTQNLRVPGPTLLPPEVMAAQHAQMVNHRGPEFAAIVKRVSLRLQYFFQTVSPVLTFPASGTGGQESAIVNVFSPGDHVVALIIGNFGARMAKIAQAYGLRVTKIEFPWGKAAEPDVVATRLREVEPFRGVMVTHNETSTGVTNDIQSIASIVHHQNPEALVIVDAVSSLSCIPFEMDTWDLDVVLTGSQKGWMTPPGMTMIAASQRAWAAHKTATLPRFYFDWTSALKSLEKWQQPATPAVSLFYALDVALELMLQEGREAIFARHAQAGAYVRSRAQKMGLKLLADPRYASNTVTALLGPEGDTLKALLKTLRVNDNLVLAAGQDHMRETLFRIGHLGHFTLEDLTQAMDALETRLQEIHLHG